MTVVVHDAPAKVIVKNDRTVVRIQEERVRVIRPNREVRVVTVGIPGSSGPTGGQGPIGLPGQGSRYVHDQAAAASIWMATHNFGAIPSSVSIIDSAGTQVYGEVRHTDINTTQLIFSAPFSGKAYIAT